MPYTSILYESIDGLLTHENSRDKMFEISCNTNDCTWQKYPEIADGRIYFGCDGTFKVGTKVNIECRNFGLPCPEVQSWKKSKIDSNEKFERCFGMSNHEISDFGPVKCKAGMRPKDCPGEVDFWEIKHEKHCRKDETEFVFYSEGMAVYS